MASVNDYGADDAARLDSPPLGGANGWAAAVAAALSNDDTPIAARLAAERLWVEDRHRFAYYAKSSQSISANTLTTVAAADSLLGDDQGAWGVGQFTVPVDGVWQFEQQALTAAAVNVWTAMSIGASERGSYAAARPGGGGFTGGLWTLSVAAGTIVRFRVAASASAAVTSTLTACRISGMP